MSLNARHPSPVDASDPFDQPTDQPTDLPTDRSLIDLDRCQTIDHQHQSTFDRFLKSRLAHASPTSPRRHVAVSLRRQIFRSMSTYPSPHDSRSERLSRGNQLVAGLTAKRFVITVVQTLGSPLPVFTIFRPKIFSPRIPYHFFTFDSRSFSFVWIRVDSWFSFPLPRDCHTLKSSHFALCTLHPAFINPAWYRAFSHRTAKPNFFSPRLKFGILCFPGFWHLGTWAFPPRPLNPQFLGAKRTSSYPY